MHIQAHKHKNWNKGIYIFSISITFTSGGSIWCFPVVSFVIACAADHNWVKVTEISLCKCFRDNLTCWYNEAHEIGSRSHKHFKKISSRLSQRCLQNSELKALCHVTVLGEAKSKPQAYYIVIVGICFDSYFAFLLVLIVEIYGSLLGWGTAGENSGLPMFLHLKKKILWSVE